MLKINCSSFIILALAGMIQSCYIDFRETVYGSGNVVTEERSVSSFDVIKVSSGLDVFITQGDDETLEVIADDNLLEYILTDVTGGILNIQRSMHPVPEMPGSTLQKKLI